MLVIEDGPSAKKHRRSTKVDDDAAAAERRKLIDAERRQLPAWAARDKLLQLLQEHRTLVLVGETGSGKTTQIPQFLLSARFGSRSRSRSSTAPGKPTSDKAGAAGTPGDIKSPQKATGVVERDGASRGAVTQNDGPAQNVHHVSINGSDGGGAANHGGPQQPTGKSVGGSDGSRAGGGAIAVTQPRRVAAMTVARRVAEEMGTKLGDKVGYAIRFEDVTSHSTRIKYMTDGLLLREALVDPLLSRYRIVIIDEAHERTVHTDVLFGLLKGVQARRGEDFRLIIMSATLDAARFVDYFPGAVAALIRGRQFPVRVMYTPKPEDNYLDAAINATLQVHADEGEGDILVFLTGQDEIDSAERLLKDRLATLQGSRGPTSSPSFGSRELLVLPIYAALPPEQQMKVFEPAPEGQRKAILATNIAETSITIPGVRYVIDTGHVKARDYNAKLGLESLAVVPVSQAQARQRSGRAGREGPGKAFRLYTEADFSVLEPTTPPEITRCNLGSVVLQLKAMGINDVLGFDFMDPPPRAAILRSLELLYALGALDAAGCLTEGVGRRLSRLPVDPMFGRVLLAATEMGCGQEAVAVVAMVSTENVFHTPRQKEREWRAARLKFVSREGDHLTLLNVFRGFLELPKESNKARTTWCSENFINIRAMRKAEDIYEQLVRFLGHPSPPGLGLQLATCGEDSTPLRRALTAGLFPHAAKLQPDGSYRVLATGRQVFLHPSSVLLDRKPACLVFNELMHTTRTYARDAVEIEARWLPELAPAVFAAKTIAAAAGPGVGINERLAPATTGVAAGARGRALRGAE